MTQTRRKSSIDVEVKSTQVVGKPMTQQAVTSKLQLLQLLRLQCAESAHAAAAAAAGFLTADLLASSACRKAHLRKGFTSDWAHTSASHSAAVTCRYHTKAASSCGYSTASDDPPAMHAAADVG
jgi:hypothetical protein